MHTRIKICGITRPEDAKAAARCGADAIGLVFTANSPRYVSIDQAQSIGGALPPLVSRVGVFQNPTAKELVEVLDNVPLDWLQFHGTESSAFCSRWYHPWLKAVPMGDGQDPQTFMDLYDGAGGFLLDAHGTGEAGGMGHTFDWTRIPAGSSAPLILAGGLSLGNVYEAVSHTRVYGVDVSSGVESAPGIKDYDLMAQFINEVRRADREGS